MLWVVFYHSIENTANMHPTVKAIAMTGEISIYMKAVPLRPKSLHRPERRIQSGWKSCLRSISDFYKKDIKFLFCLYFFCHFGKLSWIRIPIYYTKQLKSLEIKFIKNDKHD